MGVTTAPVVLAAEHIQKSLGGRRVLNGVSMAARAGELVAILGENGSGKSTLLRILAGALGSDGGRVWRGARVGYCPQEAALYPHLTPEEHFDLFGAAYGLPRPQARRRGEALLDRFGFTEYARRSVEELSGGTRQKLNLAIALLHDPAVLLLDEPYAAFDVETFRRFVAFTDEAKQAGTCIVLVTHLLLDHGSQDRGHVDVVFNLSSGVLDGYLA